MASSVLTPRLPRMALPLPLPEERLPIVYQEEEDDGMGEANLHMLWSHVLYYGVKAFLQNRLELQVYTNLNLYYRKKPLHPKSKGRPNVAADTMVVKPFTRLPDNVASYAIGEDGPAPLVVAEVLSPQTATKRDLKKKPEIYGGLSVPEYLLADPTGRFMDEPLLLKRLLPDRTWQDLRDADGGVTSQLGFRVIVDDDNLLRVIEAVTGHRFVRPDEAQRVDRLRRELEEKLQAMEAEMQRLRGSNGGQNQGKKNGRRKP